MTDIWLGLFSGIAFGFVIQRIGATDPERMSRAHLMLEPEIPQFMLMTVAFAAVGLFGLKAAGIDNTSLLPTSLVATGLAAIIFGIGWGLAGYCPGTCWAAVGEGRMDAVFAFLGGITGTAAFAHLHEALIPRLYLPTNIGRISLADWVGSEILALILLVALLFAVVWAMNRLWRYED